MSDCPRFHAEKNHKFTLGRSPDLQAKPFVCGFRSSTFPGVSEWLIGRSIVLITVAGPCRTLTGFPVMPSRAPRRMSDSPYHDFDEEKLSQLKAFFSTNRKSWRERD